MFNLISAVCHPKTASYTMQKEHEPWSCYIVSNPFYGNISTFGFNCITSQEILLLRAYAEKAKFKHVVDI